MFKKAARLAVVAMAILSTIGCSSAPKLTVAEPVGPGRSGSGRSGALQVYTATEQHAVGDNTCYYPHTGYLIYNDHGQKVKYVINHVGTMDESPMVVSLPTGSYTIVAESDAYGRVRIPVVVRPSRTTEVHLERGWKPPLNATASDTVQMPDGQPIGWRADAKTTE
jgi:hypothetical protein